MLVLSLLEWIWKGPLILVGVFFVYFLMTYPFERRWLRARIRADEWIKGKVLRGEAREIVISISEAVTHMLDHWGTLDGLDLVNDELRERAIRDRENVVKLHEDLDAFRASFQKAAVTQTSEVSTEASEKIAEISHFTRLMSESISEGGEATTSQPSSSSD